MEEELMCSGCACDEFYWYIGVDGLPLKIMCTNGIDDMMCIISGNCYKTKERALRDKDKWVTLFEGARNND